MHYAGTVGKVTHERAKVYHFIAVLRRMQRASMTREKSWRLYGIITVYIEKETNIYIYNYVEKGRKKGRKTRKLYIRSENMNTRDKYRSR